MVKIFALRDVMRCSSWNVSLRVVVMPLFRTPMRRLEICGLSRGDDLLKKRWNISGEEGERREFKMPGILGSKELRYAEVRP